MPIEIRKPTQDELETMGVFSWDIWTCEPSTFDWTYSDRETCFLLEGEVTVTAGEQKVSFGKGDLVVFPKGLSCVWEVKTAVRKHFQFG